MRPRLVPAALALATLAAAPASGQGTITAGDVTFVREATPWDVTPGASLRGVTATLAQDHLHEHGWWYRLAGDTREFNLPGPDSQSYVGATSVVVWNDVDGRTLFSAQETAQVFDAGANGNGDGGWVRIEMRIVNFRPALSLTIDLFHYADIDVAGAAADSTLPLLETPAHLGFVDGVTTDQAEHLCVGATAYQAGAFGALTDPQVVLSDGDLDDLAGTGVPFGPRDVTSGCQWSAVIPPATARSFYVYLAVGAPLWCGTPATGLFCANFESNDFATWSALVP